MSNAPKHPSQRQDLKRWDDEGGAPRSGHRSCEPDHPSTNKLETALYYFNIRTEGGVIEDPEGVTRSDLQAVRKEALASARDLIAEGDQKGEERRRWRFEIMDRANQHVLTVGFSEALDSETPG
ncbi:DUF6894 family protein [Microvirga brassicacearum]|uniref:DUF6894 family protein n=1 Tax=Microvirga brassicacearum TaxID=2580413 RepID=UPI003B84A924